MAAHSSSMAGCQPRVRVQSALLREAYAPAQMAPGTARMEGCRPPAPHPDLLAGRHLLADGQPAEMVSKEANLGVRTTRPSAMEPRACLSLVR